MGEMADMALEECIDMEAMRDDYVNSYMGIQEAYDIGFIDEMGVEQKGIQDAWNRSEIPTYENIAKELEVEELKLTNAALTSSSKKSTINTEKPFPICFVCHNFMKRRRGSFGLFYFCTCTEQNTISDKAWQNTEIYKKY